jgi:hypothetical protein
MIYTDTHSPNDRKFKEQLDLSTCTLVLEPAGRSQQKGGPSLTSLGFRLTDRQTGRDHQFLAKNKIELLKVPNSAPSRVPARPSADRSHFNRHAARRTAC